MPRVDPIASLLMNAYRESGGITTPCVIGWELSIRVSAKVAGIEVSARATHASRSFLIGFVSLLDSDHINCSVVGAGTALAGVLPLRIWTSHATSGTPCVQAPESSGDV